MKKTGIITFEHENNYGAVLQCYALKEFLKSKGAESYVLKKKKEKNVIISLRSPKDFLKSVYLSIPKIIKARKTNSFKKRCFNYLDFDAIENLDIFVLGSDQIWNLDFIKGEEHIYFAEFKKRKTSFVVSYAASVGKEALTDFEKEIFREKLKNIDIISVREEKGKELLKDLIDKEIEVLLDPTLLIPQDEWKKLIVSKPALSDKYLFLYHLWDYDDTQKTAKKIASDHNLKIVELKPNATVDSRLNEIFNPAGPLDFLRLFRDASVVVTNSFHGIAFSVLFKKEFYVVSSKSWSSRMTNLLDKLNLRKRLINPYERINYTDIIDYKTTEEILQNERLKSDEFIQNIFKLSK
jgi:hypothetical protein